MKVCAGDPFFPAADASYKNLVWENLPVPDILLHIDTPNIVSLENKINIYIYIYIVSQKKTGLVFGAHFRGLNVKWPLIKKLKRIDTTSILPTGRCFQPVYYTTVYKPV